MTRPKYTISIQELLFFFATILYIATKNIELSSAYYEFPWIPMMAMWMRYVSYLFVIFKLFILDDYTKKEIGIIVFVLTVSLIISQRINENTLFYNFLFIIAARNIKLKKVLKVVFGVQLFFTLLVFSGCLIGIIPDWTYTINGRYRHSMGYGYPNSISTHLFFLIITYLYLRGKRIQINEIFIIEIINFAIFCMTDSRTTFVLLLIFPTIAWVLKFREKNINECRFLKYCYVYSIFAIAILCIFSCWFYDSSNPIWKMLSDLLSNRLRLGHEALHTYGFQLFGQKIEWVGFGGLGYTRTTQTGIYNFVDCSYVKILLDNGLIMLVLALVSYAMVTMRAIKENDRYMCLTILFMCVYSMIEPRLIEIGFNPLVWTLSTLFKEKVDVVYNNKKKVFLLEQKYRRKKFEKTYK